MRLKAFTRKELYRHFSEKGIKQSIAYCEIIRQKKLHSPTFYLKGPPNCILTLYQIDTYISIYVSFCINILIIYIVQSNFQTLYFQQLQFLGCKNCSCQYLRTAVVTPQQLRFLGDKNCGLQNHPKACLTIIPVYQMVKKADYLSQDSLHIFISYPTILPESTATQMRINIDLSTVLSLKSLYLYIEN